MQNVSIIVDIQFLLSTFVVLISRVWTYMHVLEFAAGEAFNASEFRLP